MQNEISMATTKKMVIEYTHRIIKYSNHTKTTKNKSNSGNEGQKGFKANRKQMPK
jgi:hypothetical protein